MKRIVKKNQVIITSLAILIAVAGYLNYSENNVLNQAGKSANIVEEVNDTVKKEERKNIEKKEDSSVEELNDSDGEEDINLSDKEQESVPGEAVLTNVGTFSANAKLQREQLRAKNKEMLMDMIDNKNLSESQKTDVTNEVIHMTEIAELENEVETLLEAKGFNGAIVTIDEDSVDVVINMIDVNDKERAQIEDVVKRKTNIPVSNIIITPISVEN